MVIIFLNRKMSGFGYTNGSGLTNENHRNAVSVPTMARRLSRKFSEPAEFTIMSSPEEFIQKFGGNRVVKTVNILLKTKSMSNLISL